MNKQQKQTRVIRVLTLGILALLAYSVVISEELDQAKQFNEQKRQVIQKLQHEISQKDEHYMKLARRAGGKL